MIATRRNIPRKAKTATPSKRVNGLKMYGTGLCGLDSLYSRVVLVEAVFGYL